MDTDYVFSRKNYLSIVNDLIQLMSHFMDVSGLKGFRSMVNTKKRRLYKLD